MDRFGARCGPSTTALENCRIESTNFRDRADLEAVAFTKAAIVCRAASGVKSKVERPTRILYAEERLCAARVGAHNDSRNKLARSDRQRRRRGPWMLRERPYPRSRPRGGAHLRLF